MSKLAIFLCLLVVATCAPAVRAGFTDSITGKVGQAKDKVTSTIQSAMHSFQEQVQKIRESAINAVENLKEKAIEIMKGVYNSINNAQKAVEDKINELTKEADGVDVTECTKMSRDLQRLAIAMVANSSECVTDKIEEGTAYVENINQSIEDLSEELKNIESRAAECSKDATGGIMKSGKAITCYGTAAKDALVMTTKKIPSVVSDMTKLAYRITTLMPSLTACSATTSVGTYLEQSSDIVAKVQACVQQKINENKGATTETPTTEEPTTTEIPTTSAI